MNAQTQNTVDLRSLQTAIEINLERIERVLGPNYKLTLIAKYHGERPLKDADILLTMDSRENVLAVVERFLPARSVGEGNEKSPAPQVSQTSAPSVQGGNEEQQKKKDLGERGGQP